MSTKPLGATLKVVPQNMEFITNFLLHFNFTKKAGSRPPSPHSLGRPAYATKVSRETLKILYTRYQNFQSIQYKYKILTKSI